MYVKKFIKNLLIGFIFWIYLSTYIFVKIVLNTDKEMKIEKVEKYKYKYHLKILE